MTRLRAMTWNVWWRFGGNWRERQPGLLSVVRDIGPDLLGIQECWRADDTNLAELFAAELSATSAFIPVGLPPEPESVEEPDQAGIVMGLGLVSRWPIADVRAHPMPSEGRHLDALVATVAHPRGPLTVVVGATSWEPDRIDETTEQVRVLENIVAEAAGALPAILLADLNYDETLPAIRDVGLEDGWDAAPPGADPRTLSSTNRFAPPEARAQYDRRIDHILFAPGDLGARAVAARIVRYEPGGLPPSDHYPVMVDLEF